jgi:putative SOS response-associated peptidase YedK
MCGRFAFFSAHEAVARLFGIADVPGVEPRWNIAPTQFVAAVRESARTPARRLALLYWGLVPYWAGEKSVGARMINARCETLKDKPAFRDAYRRRRCVVPADGYYEWQRAGAVRQPYYIGLASGEPFGIAGLWEFWRDPATGDPLESCTLVTTPPAGSIAHLHDRMPAILPSERYAEWLDPRNEDLERLDRLLVPYDAAALSARPVSRRVNDARNEGAELIEPASEPASGRLL